MQGSVFGSPVRSRTLGKGVNGRNSAKSKSPPVVLLAGGPKYVLVVAALNSAGPAPENESVRCLVSF